MADVLWPPGTEKYKAKTENYPAKNPTDFQSLPLTTKEKSTYQNSPFMKNQSDRFYQKFLNTSKV